MNLNNGNETHSPSLNVSSLFDEFKAKATGVFPASKKELRADNKALLIKNSQQDAIIDALVKQVNFLSPVCPSAYQSTSFSGRHTDLIMCLYLYDCTLARIDTGCPPFSALLRSVLRRDSMELME